MSKNTLANILKFLVIFLIINYVYTAFFAKPQPSSSEPVVVAISDDEYGRDAPVSVTIENNTNADIVIPTGCPGEPLDVYTYTEGTWKQIEAKPEIECPKDPNEANFIVKAQDKLQITYDKWNHALFGKDGRYKITLKTSDGKSYDSKEFTVVKASVFRWLWITFFYQPIYNILIFLTAKLPMHDLGFAIIILTFIIRLILLVPSQKALKSQRKMQELQPKLEAIKEKHKGNQQMISMETMALWKEHKVNPFGSCLPLLIQFPVFIALFYVVGSGLNPDNSYLLYPGFVQIAYQEIHTLFLGVLELTKSNKYVLPLIVGLLQFVQMKMTMKKPSKEGKKSEMDVANGMMIYFLPVMIAVITMSVPAAAGLYWATSTLFGIGQQYFVNRGSSSEKNEDPKQIITVS